MTFICLNYICFKHYSQLFHVWIRLDITNTNDFENTIVVRHEIDCDVMDALDPCQVNPPCGGWLVV